MIHYNPRPVRFSHALTIAVILFARVSTLHAQTDTKPIVIPGKNDIKYLAAFRDVVAKSAPSVVQIRVNGKQVALGTIVGADGWIVTKASEINGKALCHFKDGREFEAKIVGVQDKFDLALLKIDAKDLKPVEWANSASAVVGDWVASAGIGETPVAVGVVSVATRLPTSQRPNFNPNSGYLGISSEVKDGGVRISNVTLDTPAGKAGVKVDDRLVSIDGTAISDPDVLMNYMTHTKPDQIVTLRVKRGDELMEFAVTLGKRPRDTGVDQNRLGNEMSARYNGFGKILQHDTVIKPVDCGGPLVDLDGKAVGINIARAGRVESYAIPFEEVEKILPDLKSGKLAPVSVKAIPKAVLEAEKKLHEAKAAVKKIEEEKAALDKKLAEAQAALKKAEAEAKDAKAKQDEK